MNKRMTAGRFAALALTLGFSACKTDISPPDVAKAIAPPSGDTNFTPPEIRRPMPSPDTDQTKPVNSAAGLSSDTAHRTAPPAPVPSAAPVSAPAVVSAEPPKSVLPVAKAIPATTTTAMAGGDPGPDGDWVLQVNVYKSEAEAKGQIARFAAQGIPAYSIPVATEGTGLAGQYWRVRVGRFKSRAEAQGYGDRKIVAAGLKFWIDRKSNENHSGGTP
jgi:cell division septation protein DedD